MTSVSPPPTTWLPKTCFGLNRRGSTARTRTTTECVHVYGTVIAVAITTCHRAEQTYFSIIFASYYIIVRRSSSPACVYGRYVNMLPFILWALIERNLLKCLHQHARSFFKAPPPPPPLVGLLSAAFHSCFPFKSSPAGSL